ncbi:MAG: hemerythrin family protein, partial [Lachnospiraceae bacterium]|nr:hemerythrin family protein [Lachnospiraceae bacterium]
YNTNVGVIDAAHQKLFSIVSRLIALNEDEAKQQHACREGIRYFKNYTFKHFSEEEAYMQAIDYDGYELHKILHDNMRDKTLPALEEELEEQDYSKEAVSHFLGICIGWLNGHILIEDLAITGRTINKWVHQPSEDKLISLEKASLQVLENFFKLEARLVSEHYGGESFTQENIICFRLGYRSNTGERMQAFLAYEERLALHILSGMVNKQIARLDENAAQAMKILSQQFMTCIGKYFAPEYSYQFERIDMLTFEQFLRTFDRSYPPYSLLFGTSGKGYMVLCIKQMGT